jgi:hypothetical protein
VFRLFYSVLFSNLSVLNFKKFELKELQLKTENGRLLKIRFSVSQRTFFDGDSGRNGDWRKTDDSCGEDYCLGEGNRSLLDFACSCC